MFLIPPIYKLEKLVLLKSFLCINLASEDLSMAKGEMSEFLLESDKELNKITTMTVQDAPFYNVEHCTEIVSKKETITVKAKISLLAQ